MLAKSDILKSPAPLFSLVDSGDHYLIAIDIPTLPTSSNQIRVDHDELIVEGQLNGDYAKIFSCLTHHDVKAVYEKGVLWLTLPKKKQPQPGLMAVV